MGVWICGCMGVWVYGCMDVSRRRSADWRERLVGRGHRIVSANRTDRQVGVELGRLMTGCGISGSINLSQPPEGRLGPYPPAGMGCAAICYWVVTEKIYHAKACGASGAFSLDSWHN